MSPSEVAQRGERARVLVLTDTRRPSFLRARSDDAVILCDAASLEGIEAEFDAAIVDGLLENEPWDRWLLQRVHRALRMDAPVTVVVPPLLSLGSATDVRFLAHASRRLLAKLVQRWRPAFHLPGPVRRRYHMPRLMRTMAALGYTAIEARRSTLTARKASSLSGLQGRGWPDAQAHRRRHAEQYPAIAAARDAWLTTFPHFRGVAARELDPSEWHEARVLVLAPHPDDELIGCGGTLCRLRSAGARLSILQATDGSELRSLRDLPESRRKTVRLDEAGRVAAALRAQLVLWRQQDSRLQCCDATITELARVLDALRPTHVFTPFLADPHADHHTLSRILAGALAIARLELQVLQYEVWSLVPANLYCDITAQAQALERLLLLYERAMRADDFVHFCESRNLARALELTGRPGYMEAFLCTSSAGYRSLADRTT